MVVLIDNYDSFTFNLVQYLRELGAETRVFRNDQITLSQIHDRSPKFIIVSPGPGRPENAGISLEVIKHFGANTPILGVCLGHQCIAEVFGGRIISAKKCIHGKTSPIYHNQSGIFDNIENPFSATRYHSLVIDPRSLPKTLKTTAWTQNEHQELDEIMAIRHDEYPIEGVQFHPESILTTNGKQLLKNFLTYYEY